METFGEEDLACALLVPSNQPEDGTGAWGFSKAVIAQ
jgi:hypothetical protein